MMMSRRLNSASLAIPSISVQSLGVGPLHILEPQKQRPPFRSTQDDAFCGGENPLTARRRLETLPFRIVDRQVKKRTNGWKRGVEVFAQGGKLRPQTPVYVLGARLFRYFAPSPG